MSYIEKDADDIKINSMYVLKAPFPKGEATDPQWSCKYGSDVSGKPFPLLEWVTSTSAECSYIHAFNVLKSPFPEGEKAIATDAKWSLLYAVNVLKAPFPLGEATIAANVECSFWYEKYILQAPLITEATGEQK